MKASDTASVQGRMRYAGCIPDERAYVVTTRRSDDEARVRLTHHGIENGKEDAGRAEIRGDFGEEATDDDDQ